MADAEALTLGDFAQRLADDPAFRADFVKAMYGVNGVHEILDAIAAGEPDPPEAIEISLKGPIEAAGADPISVLQLREPIGAELLKVQGKAGYDRVIELMFIQTGAPVSGLKKLPQRALNKAARFYNLFG